MCGGTCEADLDDDGVCDAFDPCVGQYDACGICNGPGEIYACGCWEIPAGDCDCDGNELDAIGICGGLAKLIWTTMAFVTCRRMRRGCGCLWRMQWKWPKWRLRMRRHSGWRLRCNGSSWMPSALWWHMRTCRWRWHLRRRRLVRQRGCVGRVQRSWGDFGVRL